MVRKIGIDRVMGTGRFEHSRRSSQIPSFSPYPILLSLTAIYIPILQALIFCVDPSGSSPPYPLPSCHARRRNSSERLAPGELPLITCPYYE